MSEANEELLELTANIVSAYVSRNSVTASDLPDLISGTHAALAKLGQPEESPASPQIPAVSIKKSITPDYLICLDDGLKFKSLKRHLGALGMTPEQYRKKWDLPVDYPMVAPSYAEQRSTLAKEIGLGRKAKTAEAADEGTTPVAKAKRGRPAKPPEASA